MYGESPTALIEARIVRELPSMQETLGDHADKGPFRVLSLFEPLPEYSPLARGTAGPGEINAFRLFASDGAQPLYVFCLAGGDHFHRFTPLHSFMVVRSVRAGVRRMHGPNCLPVLAPKGARLRASASPIL